MRLLSASRLCLQSRWRHSHQSHGSLWRRVDAFIPAYESALAIIDLITAVLLFGQFGRTRTLALLVLACGYLFDFLIIIPHALTFPGVFAANGLLGAQVQSTAWLYCFWHGGFALYVVFYAALASSARTRIFCDLASSRALAIGIAATLTLVAALTVLATAGHQLLTPIMNGADYSMLVTKGISPAICLLSVLALGLLWPLRHTQAQSLAARRDVRMAVRHYLERGRRLQPL